MLNSNFSSFDLNANSEASNAATKMGDLLQSITEARKSITHWQDQKTSALIQLDSLTYDVKAIDAEKRALAEYRIKIDAQMTDQTRAYRAAVAMLTDDVQLLHLENDELKNQLLTLTTNFQQESEALRAQLKESFDLQEQSLDRFNEELAEEARSHAETAQILGEKLKTAAAEKQVMMRAHEDMIHAIISEKESAERRSTQLEAEISGMKARMMNVLKPTQSQGEETTVSFSNENQTTNPIELTTEVGTVEDFLKRCGY
jgi:hypothetical protein